MAARWQKQVLDLSTLEGCKAELTYVTWKPTGRELILRPVNRKSNALPLSHHAPHSISSSSSRDSWEIAGRSDTPYSWSIGCRMCDEYLHVVVCRTMLRAVVESVAQGSYVDAVVMCWSALFRRSDVLLLCSDRRWQYCSLLFSVFLSRYFFPGVLPAHPGAKLQ